MYITQLENIDIFFNYLQVGTAIMQKYRRRRRGLNFATNGNLRGFIARKNFTKIRAQILLFNTITRGITFILRLGFKFFSGK